MEELLSAMTPDQIEALKELLNKVSDAGTEKKDDASQKEEKTENE